MLTRRRYAKGKLTEVTAMVASCHIGMEASYGPHHLGRQLQVHGHGVRLMPPKYVQPVVKRDKNDTKDAEACADACQRRTTRFVAVKTEPQLAMRTLHRHRARLVGNSTQLVNQTRGFLLQRRLAIAQGKHRFAARLPEILKDADNSLRSQMRALLENMLAEWEELRGRIHAIDRELVTEAHQRGACERLLDVPGIGAQTATALAAAMGDGKAFENAHDCAAWLGLMPAEHSTGSRQRLRGISKRGNRYPRTLLVYCARSGLETLAMRSDGLGSWLRRMLKSKDRPLVIVALAARLARIV